MKSKLIAMNILEASKKISKKRKKGMVVVSIFVLITIIVVFMVSSCF